MTKYRLGFIAIVAGLSIAIPTSSFATPNGVDNRPAEYQNGTLPPATTDTPAEGEGVNGQVLQLPLHYQERWADELKIVDDQLNSLNAEIMVLNDKITQTDTDLKLIKAKINETDTNLLNLSSEIRLTEKDYLLAKNQYDNYMRMEQIRGTETGSPLMQAIFSASSLSDIVSRYIDSVSFIKQGEDIAKRVKDRELELKGKKEDYTLLKEKQLQFEKEYTAKLDGFKQDKKNVLLKLKQVGDKRQEEEKRIKLEQDKLIQDALKLLESKGSAEGVTFEGFDTSLVGFDSSKSQFVVKEAMTHLGVPYVWGGTTVNGFDCSGLMQYVYAKAGVKIPRVARQQQDFGFQISPYEVQAGDLVFYKDPAVHVIMYIGGGMYIHAPQPGDVVRIEKYNPSQWTSAVRVIGSSELALSKEVF